MPKKCTICHHPNRDQIDFLLLQNETYREITRKFGINKSAISRHQQHLQYKLSPPQSLLLHRLINLEAEVRDCYTLALENQDFRLARAILRDLVRLNQNLGLIWRQPPEAHPMEDMWQEFTRIFATALQPFPEAKKAVSQALTRRCAEMDL